MEEFSQYIIKTIAKKNGIKENDAAKFIDSCFKKIAANTNKDYTEIYNLFYTFSNISKCLVGICNNLEIKECEKSCHCVIFDNKCVSKYIPNAGLINADPDKYAKQLKTSELEELVKYASFLYYNYTGGGLTDNSFDALEYNLNKRIKTKGRRYEKIGSMPIEKLRTKLEYPMFSLEKLKPGMEKLYKFIAQPEIIWSEKLDGVSGMIIYQSGTIKGIYTRGDGIIGGNVTFLKDYIKNLPKLDKNIVVRGEFILTKRIWETKYKNTYSNPRSFVSGKINQGFIDQSLIDIQFLAYQIIDKPDTPEKMFRTLIALGFQTPLWGKFKNPLLFDLVNKYRNLREISEYNIDGLVISHNIPEAIKVGNPEFSKAFKMTLETQLRKTKVVSVDWNISRYGKFIPVCVFESVYIDGVRIHRASAHNASHIVDWKMTKGTEIVVTRSGDVIPQIKNVTINQNNIPDLPNEEYPWHWERKDIILDKIEGNPFVEQKRILYFCETLNIKGLGPVRIKNLYENGLNTIEKLVKATPKELINIKGIGKKLSTDIYNNIQDKIKTATFDQFYESITTFKSSIGRKMILEVLRYYPEITTDTKQEITKKLNTIKIPGIGDKRKQGLIDTIPKFRELLYNIVGKDKILTAFKHQQKVTRELSKKGYNPLIKDKTFVFTGFLGNIDTQLEQYIYLNWGYFGTTVNNKVTAVIAANSTNITEKMITASDLKIPVYTVDEFIKNFNIPYKGKFELKESEEIDE